MSILIVVILMAGALTAGLRVMTRSVNESAASIAVSADRLTRRLEQHRSRQPTWKIVVAAVASALVVALIVTSQQH